MTHSASGRCGPGRPYCARRVGARSVTRPLPGMRLHRLLLRWAPATIVRDVLESAIADLQHEAERASTRRTATGHPSWVLCDRSRARPLDRAWRRHSRSARTLCALCGGDAARDHRACGARRRTRAEQRCPRPRNVGAGHPPDARYHVVAPPVRRQPAGGDAHAGLAGAVG